MAIGRWRWRWRPSRRRARLLAAARGDAGSAERRRRWRSRRSRAATSSQTLTLAAEFRPFQEIDVHAKVAGYVKSINVDVGDRVSAGQLLAVLEIPELQDEMQQDEAAVKRAEEEINRAQADLERAESAHEVAHLGATRLAGVMKERPNLVAQQDIDEAHGTRPRRRSAGRDGEGGARRGAGAARRRAGQREQDEDAVRLRADHRAVRRRHHASLRRHRRDDSGRHLVADAGDADRAAVAEQPAASHHPGARIGGRRAFTSARRSTSSVQALDRTFPGKVARFADKLDPETRTMHDEVDVPNPKLELVPGMYADASIALDQAQRRARRRRSRRSIATDDKPTRDGGRPRTAVSSRATVTVGLETPDRVEIRRGLRAGDLVVVGNRAQLKAGHDGDAEGLEPRRRPKGAR